MDLIDAYHEGYEAYHRGVLISRNPYACGLRAWREWLDGWQAAQSACEW